MQAEATSLQKGGTGARLVAELLACPAEAAALLTPSAEIIEFEPGSSVFRQGQECRGVYLVMSGRLSRRLEGTNARIALGMATPGELVDLAAALGDGRHTYSLSAQSAGSLLLLPIEALRRAFDIHPPLKMQLLEELAREVSRAYRACSIARALKMQQRSRPMRGVK